MSNGDVLPDIIGSGGQPIEARPVILYDLDGNPASATQDFYQTTGAISAQGEEVTLECPGTASATIHLLGTFTGTLEVTGVAGDGANDVGGRLIFKSGVGSLGSNVVSTSGDHDDEWRVVTGGQSVTIRCTAYTSGSLAVVLGATRNPSVIFINGPVHNANEEAVRAGRGYLASTSNLQVTNGNVLDVILDNPSDSGKNVFLYNRLFTNQFSDVLEYQAYGSPTATLSQAANAANLRIGGAASAALMTYEVRSSASAMGGNAGSGEALPPEQNYNRPLLIIIPPGFKIGFRLSGAGNNLTNSARLACTLEWYEEVVA